MRINLRSLLLGVAAVSLLSTTAIAKKKKSDPASDMQPLADKPPPPDPKALNAVTVGCPTAGADVFVDAEMIGNTPIDLPVPVSNGSHTIRVVKLGYAPYTDVFKAVPGKPVHLDVSELIPISGVLHVRSELKEARVLIDGKYVGDAPVDVEMEPGPRAVQVSKVCFDEFFKNVLAVAGQEITVEAALAELPPAKNPCIVKPPPPIKWYQKPVVWVVGIGAVVAVALVAGVIGYIETRDPLDGADMRFTIMGLSLH